MIPVFFDIVWHKFFGSIVQFNSKQSLEYEVAYSFLAEERNVKMNYFLRMLLLLTSAWSLKGKNLLLK